MGQCAGSSASLRALEANLWKVCAVRGLAVSMGFVVPMLVEQLLRYQLTLADVFMLEIVFSATWLFADVPCGYFADKYGRRCSIITGAVFFIVGAIVFSRGTRFEHFVCSETLLGLGHAFITGAEQALLRRSLERLSRGADFDRIWARAQCIELGSAVLMSIIGGALFFVDERAPAYAAIASFVVLLAVAISTAEPGHGSGDPTGAKQVGRLVTVAADCVGNRRVLWCTAFFASIFAVLQSALWLYSHYLKSAGIDRSNLGWIFASMALVGSLAALLTGRREIHANHRRTCALLASILVGALLLAASMPGWLGVGSLIAMQTVRGTSRVLASGWLRREVGEHIFATAVSLQGMAWRSSAIIALVTMRMLVGHLSPYACLSALAAIVLVCTIPLLLRHPWRST